MNFDYLNATGAAEREPTFHPGDVVSLTYEVEGFREDSSGKADVSSDTTLTDGGGVARSDTSQARFNNTLSPSGRIRFTYRTTLSDGAQAGDYRMDIKLHDAVSGSDFEFRPLIRVEAKGK